MPFILLQGGVLFRVIGGTRGCMHQVGRQGGTSVRVVIFTVTITKTVRHTQAVNEVLGPFVLELAVSRDPSTTRLILVITPLAQTMGGELMPDERITRVVCLF